MSRPLRISLLALAVALALAPPAGATETLDTGKLPRPAGAREVHVSPQTTIIVTTATVEAAAQDLASRLAAAGWQAFADPFSRPTVDPNAIQMTLRKGANGLTVRIAPAPAQGGATAINFVATPLRHDLPFPVDGEAIRYDPNRPHLEALTRDSFDKVQAFYRSQMEARGWTLFLPPDGSPAVAGDGKTERAFYTRQGQRPLLLFLRQVEGGATAVKLEVVPQQVLPGTQRQAERPVAPRPAAPQSAAAGEVDRMIGAVLQDVGRSLQAAPPAAPPASGGPTTGPALALAPEATAPIPLPANAEEVAVDQQSGRVSYRSPSAVQVLAGLYRQLMPAAGWTAQPSTIARDNMVVLSYRRGGKPFTITIMAMGPATRVTAQGPAIAQSEASAPAPRGAAANPPAENPTEQALRASEVDGLPLPQPNRGQSRAATPFRTELTVKLSASPAALVAFYREELTRRGWTERSGAEVGQDRATVAFEGPQGRASLRVERNGRDTVATLLVRREAEARKAGLLPRPDMARLILGNAAPGAATVTIGAKTLTVAPGTAARGQIGPSVELAPGAHRVTVRFASGATLTETVQLGRDEIWGLMLAPHGALPVQAY